MPEFVPDSIFPSHGYLVWWTLFLGFIGWRIYMARGAPWSPEEDAIVLSDSNITALVETLESAGFTGRTNNAVKQRRQELRKKGVLGPTTSTRPSHDGMVGAATQYEAAKARIARLKEELHKAEAALAEAQAVMASELQKGG